MKIKKIIISLLLFFLIIPFVNVSALSFSSSSVGYGYTQTYNGNTSTRTFTTFSSSNLTKYNYELPNSSDIDVDEFDFRFTISGNFQKDTNYITTFNWYSYNSQNDVFYTYFSHLVSDAKCRVTNWNSTNESESACFTNWNVSGQNVNNDYVKVTFTFTPKKTFYGLTLYFTMPSPYNSYPSDGWEITDLEYRIITSDSQDIINNQNQNTQNVINNQNNNTQSIINNQNQNTQAQIESQKVCNYTKISSSDIVLDGYLLNSSGVTTSSNGWGVSDYIDVGSTSSIKVLTKLGNNNAYACYYSDDKSLISCSVLNSYSDNTSYNLPTGTKYFRSSFYKLTNKPIYEIYLCKNGNQAVDDTLTDTNIDGANSDASNFFSGFTTETYGLTGVITAPLNVIQSITSKTCSPLVLPLPFVNQNLTLPCMGEIYSQYFGDFLTIYQTITFGIVAYWVVVRIFNLVKDFKNPDHDEIEVLDL